MEHVAKELAEHVKAKVKLPPARLDVKVEEEEVENFGDIVVTLGLPKSQTLFEPQTVTIHRVLDAASGEPIAFREDADVVFLGDSFSNIYSAPQMNWGDAAGLHYQLARELGRPIDALVENGQSATVLRQKLANRKDPLKGKRVLVWEVAMHELCKSNWKVVPIAQPPSHDTTSGQR
jgi:hypothetical protein